MAGLLSSVDIASITATVASSLDQSLPLYRKTVAQDGYGHSTETWPGTPTSMLACNVYKPSAPQLQAFANIIGTKEALMLRFLPISDGREGDQVQYNGRRWMVNYILIADSYTVASDALMTVIM